MLILTSRQKAIIVGSILGDAYVQKTGEKNARLRLEHGFRQKEYLFWKAEELKRLFQGKPAFVRRRHPLTGKVYKYWRWQSNSTPILGRLRKIFYQNGKKIIPENLSKLLTSKLALSVWYMDDGYYYVRDRCAYIYLGNVTNNEADIASQTLEKNFGLETQVRKKKKGFVLYFSPQEVIKLKHLVEKHLLPLFNYKIPSNPVTT